MSPAWPADVATLQTANAELAAQIAEFRSELAVTSGTATGSTTFVAAEHPEFSQYVGEQLSSWSGPTRRGPCRASRTCASSSRSARSTPARRETSESPRPEQSVLIGSV